MRLDALAVIAVGALAVILLWWWRSKSDPRQARLPPELRSAGLVYAERLFQSAGPVSISARVDRVYRNAAGVLVLVELKTRETNRTYQSDVIELSAQRVALMTHTGDVVADYAYIVTERPDGFRMGCHQVRLISHADVIFLAIRRGELFAGKVEPQSTCSSCLCRKCAFVRPCDPSSR
ncbi:MAG: hypothetical protein PHQ58_15250 [Rhodoferax sp.]|uniref:hypothetical protein n=1 Tax=Rhodoferax sp. TaxID=50421 RepID=UPI00261235CF|nr:hypothetical protein [Rhodoferax sp.]MDD2881783.1 hypothetical protein [Rhodoferax sp.]